jgi:hypothetical protein
VHVGGQPPVGSRPGRVEVQRERSCGPRPLHLQVRGRSDDDQPSRMPGKLVPSRRERKGRLAGAGRRNREEVRLFGLDELIEGGLLPRP